MQLTVDTSWWTRYRSRTGNPDLGDSFPNAIPTLGVRRHTAIPRTDDDVKPDPTKPLQISDFTQAIANTAVDVVDPVTKVKVTFPGADHMLGEDLQTNLIMPEPTAFLSEDFPAVSIIRPTATRGAAMGAVRSFADDGLFIGQSKEFFQYLRDLAEDADEAVRET
jgi:hypothetical protein